MGANHPSTESERLPLRWRQHNYDSRSAGSLSQFIRAVLERHGGACTRDEIYSAIRADRHASERLCSGQGLPRLLQNMKHSGFVTLDGDMVRRTGRKVGRLR